jgi:hypothetical protein
MSSTTITRGNSHETFYVQPSLTPTVMSANLTAVQSFALPGLTTTDLVQIIGYNGSQTTGVVVGEADCFANNVLSIQFANVTASTQIPAIGTYSLQVVRLEGPAPATAV